MTDYAMAAKGIAQNAFLTGDYSPIARTLEALDTEREEHKAALALYRANLENWKRALDERDTERTRADEAEKRERELREAVGDLTSLIKEVAPAYYECTMVANALHLIQPEPDPLIEALREAENFEAQCCSTPKEKANDLRAALAKRGYSIVKGES